MALADITIRQVTRSCLIQDAKDHSVWKGALFHLWVMQDDGDGPYGAAIVEDKTGQVSVVYAGRVRFIDTREYDYPKDRSE